MSVETMALVLHHSRATGTEKLVLLGIANHAGDGGAWPSVGTLARYANVHERNVQRAISRLVALGEVIVHVQDGGRRNTKDHERPNRYDVTVACPITCDRTSNHRERKLPASPAALWIDPVAPVPPGGASATAPVTGAPPHPVAPAPPEPSTQPPTNAGSWSVTPPRASTCAVCSLPALDCQRRAKVSGHSYTPLTAS